MVVKPFPVAEGGHVRKTTAMAGSVGFFVLAPGIVAGWVPWRLTGWRVGLLPPYALPGRALGVALVTSGVAVLVHAFARFVLEGAGTPAPVAPPDHLVIGAATNDDRSATRTSVKRRPRTSQLRSPPNSIASTIARSRCVRP